jgi:hypothetical protein
MRERSCEFALAMAESWGHARSAYLPCSTHPVAQQLLLSALLDLPAGRSFRFSAQIADIWLFE